MEWVKFYPGRFEIGTRHLSASECGCYIRLLCAQALSGDLPVEFEKLSRIAGGMTESEWSAIEDKFPVQDGKRYNPKMQDTMAEAERATLAARAAGRKGGLARAAKAAERGEASSDAQATLQQKERQTEKQNPLSAEAGSEQEAILFASICNEEFGLDRVKSMTLARKLREANPGGDYRVWFSSLVANSRKARSPKAYFLKSLKKEFGI